MAPRTHCALGSVNELQVAKAKSGRCHWEVALLLGGNPDQMQLEGSLQRQDFEVKDPGFGKILSLWNKHGPT